VLGASTWRIDEITHDRVLVSPAPGEPGKMPFWHGDRPGRPIEFGRRIGALTRELRAMPRSGAMAKLVREHDLDERAAENVLRYLADQELATEEVPDDRTIVIERVRDELGDWRVCVLTPLGSRVHAPWAMAVSAKLKAAGADVETMWTEDGFVLRFPETDAPPDVEFLLLMPLEASEMVMQQLGSTALFAAKFREAASRALLLPRRRADGRTPLWQQRKRAYDLLSVASRYAGFPILLEAYRECLRDVFDMPALMETLRDVAGRAIRVHVVDSRTPSPFAGALLFGYVANYIYDGDAPLAERRAQALSIDQDQLRELLGDADLRELLDSAAIEETEEQLQCVAEGYRARGVDGLHDLLLRLGDLTRAEIAQRSDGEPEQWIAKLIRARRALELMFAGERRVIAVEDAARMRDALGVPLPPGLPAALLDAAPDALLDIVRRYARTHGPFTTPDVAQRYALGNPAVEPVLQRLVGMGRVVEGGFRPGGVNREWIDAEVLRTAVHALARCAAAASRSGCAAGRDREPAGRAAVGVAAGDRDSSRAHCGIQACRFGHVDRGGRGGVGGSGASGRARWTRRFVSGGEAAGAVAGAGCGSESATSFSVASCQRRGAERAGVSGGGVSACERRIVLPDFA
jgi:ATP-dependent Lhr-like helicase